MPIPAPVIDRFVQAEGEKVRHFIGIKCPCHDAHGQPSPTCTLHELGGWFYPEENRIVGLVTSIAEHKEWIEAGVTLPGDCVFSPLSKDVVSEGDKIVFTWPLPFGQGDALVRGAEESDILYYPAAKAIYCIDIDRGKYIEGTDYRLNGRAIEWEWAGKPVSGKAPAVGTKYTVKYMAFIEWIAMDPPTNRISAGVDIGSKVLLRKKHIFEQ